MHQPKLPVLLSLPLLLLLAACNGSGVSSDEEAELAYLGLDTALVKAMVLGFDGFNAADSANIAPQSTSGDVSGTLTVSGQVDQGASDNKGMRLELVLEGYSDHVDLDLDGEDEDDDREFSVTYWTDADEGLPAFDLQLKDMPDGTLSGTLAGAFDMRGDLEGRVTLALTLDGTIEDDGLGGTQRVDGATTVSGRATGPGGGVYEIDVEI